MKKILIGLMLFFCMPLCFGSILVQMTRADADGRGQKIGTVRLDDTIYGLLLTPRLHGLSAGLHGFAVYTVPSCYDYANAAGEHFDPVATGRHNGPFKGDGHLGDLPVLMVEQNGAAFLSVLAPRLKLADVKHHALVIIAGGDNYSDEPMKVNGSQRRIACGVIPYFN